MQSGAESEGHLDAATLECSQAPRSHRPRRCWRRWVPPHRAHAAHGPAVQSGPGRGGEGCHPRTGPHRVRGATARPAPPPARRAAPRRAPAAPQTGCSRSSARRLWLRGSPESRSCYRVRLTRCAQMCADRQMCWSSCWRAGGRARLRWGGT